MKICNEEKCTGCMACLNICPSNAIEITLSSTFKPVAKINTELCINCGACQRLCPQLYKKEYNKSYKCYAAYNVAGADCLESSSAGVADALCCFVTDNGGVCFGAAYSKGSLVHSMASSYHEARAFRGSKYVQSDIQYTYRKAKELLQCGKEVLFTGTPCQIAGLYAFLGKDYPKLITADIICHGTPPANYLNDYLKKLGVHEKCERVSFRQGSEYNLIVYDAKGNVLFKKNAAFDPYYRAFYNNISLRDNCYDCPYANATNRPSDISLGDFWKINKQSLREKADGGISLVLINTKKGEEFWNKAGINCEERPLTEAIEGNSQLRAPSKRNADTDVFLKNYSKGFTYAVNKTCVKKNIIKNKLGFIKESIKIIIKKGLRL